MIKNYDNRKGGKKYLTLFLSSRPPGTSTPTLLLGGEGRGIGESCNFAIS
jgi:hypothetical protein